MTCDIYEPDELDWDSFSSFSNLGITMKIRYLTVLCYLYRKLIVVTLNLTKYLFYYNYFFFIIMIFFILCCLLATPIRTNYNSLLTNFLEYHNPEEGHLPSWQSWFWLNSYGNLPENQKLYRSRNLKTHHFQKVKTKLFLITSKMSEETS